MKVRFTPVSFSLSSSSRPLAVCLIYLTETEETSFLRVLEKENAGQYFFGTLILSPVLGLRAVLAPFTLLENVPTPENL